METYGKTRAERLGAAGGSLGLWLALRPKDRSVLQPRLSVAGLVEGRRRGQQGCAVRHHPWIANSSVPRASRWKSGLVVGVPASRLRPGSRPATPKTRSSPGAAARPQHRQGRRRPQAPGPGLLRAARRPDPLSAPTSPARPGARPPLCLSPATARRERPLDGPRPGPGHRRVTAPCPSRHRRDPGEGMTAASGTAVTRLTRTRGSQNHMAMPQPRQPLSPAAPIIGSRPPASRTPSGRRPRRPGPLTRAARSREPAATKGKAEPARQPYHAPKKQPARETPGHSPA